MFSDKLGQGMFAVHRERGILCGDCFEYFHGHGETSAGDLKLFVHTTPLCCNQCGGDIRHTYNRFALAGDVERLSTGSWRMLEPGLFITC